MKKILGLQAPMELTSGKHISLNIGEKKEEKEENQVLYSSVRLP